MAKKKADLLLHPVRMRIIQAIMSKKPMSPLELLEVLQDVPQATLYRQIKVLEDADILRVVSTHKRRGALEKVYGIDQETLHIPDDELEHTTREEHVRYYLTYQANVLQEVEAYVMSRDPNHYKEDGFGYWQTPLHLTEQEQQEFAEKLVELVQTYAQNEPRSDRNTVTMATTFVPQIKGESS
ncbi:transcriptional regulator [Halalkalibacterium halodurans]|uniref:transcriptional regulator n=1 Tax=Halalkalibacterium halodurans TaxID=86665 RepID=UPI002E1DC5A5|nr:transcriptional regulator [Halalkalibacterium halodurans]